jgi:hypothetical protein
MPEADREDELLEETLYDVSASIHQIERWPLVKRGYIDLSMYLGFFVLFIAIVLMQTEVTRGSVPFIARACHAAADTPPPGTSSPTLCAKVLSCSRAKWIPSRLRTTGGSIFWDPAVNPHTTYSPPSRSCAALAQAAFRQNRSALFLTILRPATDAGAAAARGGSAAEPRVS